MLVSILLFVVYLVAVCAPIHAEARYSVPLIPFLAILAAIPICRLIEYLREPVRRHAARWTSLLMTILRRYGLVRVT